MGEHCSTAGFPFHDKTYADMHGKSGAFGSMPAATAPPKTMAAARRAGSAGV